MGYAIIFFANVAISNASELIGFRRSHFVFFEMIKASVSGTFLCRTARILLKNRMGNRKKPHSQSLDFQHFRRFSFSVPNKCAKICNYQETDMVKPCPQEQFESRNLPPFFHHIDPIES